jgi:hypothetical protein
MPLQHAERIHAAWSAMARAAAASGRDEPVPEERKGVLSRNVPYRTDQLALAEYSQPRVSRIECSPLERLFNWIQRWSAGAHVYAGARSFFASLLISRSCGRA